MLDAVVAFGAVLELGYDKAIVFIWMVFDRLADVAYSRHKSTTLGRNLAFELFSSPSCSLLSRRRKITVAPRVPDEPLNSIFSEVVDIFSIGKRVG